MPSGGTGAHHSARPTAMNSIYLAGTEEQKQKWLPSMARMEKVGCFALTEPLVGSGTVLVSRPRRNAKAAPGSLTARSAGLVTLRGATSRSRSSRRATKPRGTRFCSASWNCAPSVRRRRSCEGRKPPSEKIRISNHEHAKRASLAGSAIAGGSSRKSESVLDITPVQRRRTCQASIT